MRRPRAPATIRSALAALAAIVVAPLAALGGYGILHAYQDRRDAELEASAELARAVALGFEGFIGDVVHVEQTLGVTSADHSTARISSELRAVAAEHPEIRDMSWIGPDGRVRASSEPALVGKSFFARDYFHDIARGAAWRVSPLFPSLIDDAPLFAVACGIRRPDGGLLAVVVAAIDADRLGSLLGRRSRGGWIGLIDSQGTLVAMAPERPLDWETRRRTADHPWVERALAGGEVRGVFDAATTGERRIGAVVPIPSIGWAAHASRPLVETLGPARREAAENALAALAILLVALGVAFVMAHRIVSPLRALEQHAAVLARGSPAPARIRGPVEVRRVARALDAMAASLAARHAELEASRRGAEEATARAEARGAELDAIVAALPVGLLVLGPDGRAVRANEVARAILGLTDEDLRRTPAERCATYRAKRPDGTPLPPEEHPAVRALRGETVHGAILRIEPGRGASEWVALSAAPVRAPDDAGRGAVVTVLDLTQLRGVERERDTLLHTVSHDLRTPLHVMVSHAELLRRRGDEETRRRAEAILASAGRMRRLVEDLVDAARLETGRVKLRLEPVELGAFLAAWRDRMAGALQVDRVRIAASASLPVVVADPARLDQILGNLVTNALKYSAEGARVDVELAAAPEALRLSVRDRGQGIAPDDLPRVFDRYWRARSTGRAEGLGLGLFITRKLVEAHGWRIEVASEVGRGTTFTVVIPLDGVRAAPGQGAAA